MHKPEVDGNEGGPEAASVIEDGGVIRWEPVIAGCPKRTNVTGSAKFRKLVPAGAFLAAIQAAGARIHVLMPRICPGQKQDVDRIDFRRLEMSIATMQY